MKIITIIASLLLLIIPCIAEPDSITAGPYKVSFDLGIPKEEYKVNVTHQDSSVATIEIRTVHEIISYMYNRNKINRLGLLEIELLSFENESIYSKPDILKKSWEHFLSRGTINGEPYYNKEVVEREIDGYDGIVASATVPKSFRDSDNYWAEYYQSPTMRVMFFSAYRALEWKEGFLRLLDTIHVEEINEIS